MIKPNRILVAIDFSDISLVSLEVALSLMIGSDATLYLLHVLETHVGIEPICGWISPSDADQQEKAMERLSSLVPETLQRDMRIERDVLVGSPLKEIARFAQEKGADMIVVGTHGRRGLTRALMGSTAEGLLREAPCQVLVVKPHLAARQATRRPHQSQTSASRVPR